MSFSRGEQERQATSVTLRPHHSEVPSSHRPLSICIRVGPWLHMADDLSLSVWTNIWTVTLRLQFLHLESPPLTESVPHGHNIR